jgi:NADPH:quinone reductase-like Zn-dependent oxidoreductase
MTRHHTQAMRAITLHTHGGPEQLIPAEIPDPEPLPGEVVVDLTAAALNHRDVWQRTAPGNDGAVLGSDGAGRVSALGSDVTGIAVGDEVVINPSVGWGDAEDAPADGWAILGVPRQGTYAERIAIPADHVRPRPHELTWHESAALPLAGLTAWQILVDTIRLQQGDDILIHGAAGGVGHLAVQIAKARGANVIGTARAEQTEWLEGLGADVVIDYREQRFEELVGELDAVIDFTGQQGEASLAVLRPGGLLVSVPSGVPEELTRRAAESSRRATGFLVEPDPVGLAGLDALIEAGKLQVHVDRAFDLEQVSEAHRVAEDHHGGGKIVLRV